MSLTTNTLAGPEDVVFWNLVNAQELQCEWTKTWGPDSNIIGTASTTTEGVKYGWLGAKERATQTTGVTLMGARVYNPSTGSFSSADPVFGGNTTAYAYPQDPVNGFDLDGRCWGPDSICGAAKKVGHVAKSAGKTVYKHRAGIVKGLGIAAAGTCIVASGGACTVLAGAALTASLANRTDSFVKKREYKSRSGWTNYTTRSALDVVTWGFAPARESRAITRLPTHSASGAHALRYFGTARRTIGQAASAAWAWFG